MFPTFEIPPQHAETVGARKARRAKEEDSARRSSSATSHSSGSVNSASANSAKEKSAFGWFAKSKKGVQEISTLPSLQKPQAQQSEPEIRENLPCPPTAPLPPPPNQRDLSRISSSRSDYDHAPFTKGFSPPPPEQRDISRISSSRSDYDHAPSPKSFSPPPPSRSLPSLPPSSALPPLPPLPTSPESNNGRKSHYSTTTASSKRTTFSGRSVFSNSSQYDSSISEASYDDSRLGNSMQFETVERGSRSGSHQSDTTAKTSQGPFARALAKMENAGARIVAARLSEEWEGLDDDESYQEVVFEKRLWALTAYQRLTQNKQLQSPAHEVLSNSRPEDQRRILNLHGSLADGWMLANRYPTATIYTLSCTKTSRPPTPHPAPLNHHALYVPSLSSPTPFPDNYFDAIVSRSIATLLRTDDWARSFFDCMRVLKPGAHMEVLSVDPHLSCEGPKLSAWVDEYLTCRLEAHGLSMQASETVLDTMEIVGLENIRRARVALPAHSPKAVARAAPPPSHTYGATPAPASQDTIEAGRMMSFLGRHFYQDMYGREVHVSRGEEWFWAKKDVRDECERYKTKMILTIACAQKPGGLGRESYLDI